MSITKSHASHSIHSDTNIPPSWPSNKTQSSGQRFLLHLVAKSTFSKEVTDHYKLIRYDLGPLSCAVKGHYHASYNAMALQNLTTSRWEQEQKMKGRNEGGRGTASSELARTIEAGNGTPLEETAAFHMGRHAKTRHVIRWWLGRIGFGFFWTATVGCGREIMLDDAQVVEKNGLIMLFQYVYLATHIHVSKRFRT